MKVLSAIITFLGVSVIIALEVTNSPTSIEGEMISVWNQVIMGAAISFGGFSRLYLMYEAVKLASYNKRDGKVAFYMSLTISAGLFIYGTFLWKINILHDHSFGLFILVNLGLMFAEWIFAKRTGYSKPEIQIKLEKDLSAMEKWGDGLKEELDKTRNELSEALARAGVAEIELSESQKREQETSDISEALRSQLEVTKSKLRPGSQCYEMIKAGKEFFYLDNSDPNHTKKFKVCECGKRAYISGNRAKSLSCECGKLLWEKTKLESEAQ